MVPHNGTTYKGTTFAVITSLTLAQCSTKVLVILVYNNQRPKA